MRSFIISAILFALLGIGFLIGIIDAQATPMLISFCAMPFVMLFLGWSARGLISGKRVALVPLEQHHPAQPQQRRRPTPQQQSQSVEQIL